MFKVIEKTKVWFSISLVIILVGLVLMATKGLNFGIDFKGGTKIVVDFGKDFDKVEAETYNDRYVFSEEELKDKHTEQIKKPIINPITVFTKEANNY